MGITNSGAFAGAIVGPITLGQLSHRFSYEAAWPAAAGASLAAALAIPAMPRLALRRPHARASEFEQQAAPSIKEAK